MYYILRSKSNKRDPEELKELMELRTEVVKAREKYAALHKEIGKTEEKEITANKNIIAKNNNEIKEVIKDLEGHSRHKHKHRSRHTNPEKVIENDHDSNDNFLDVKDNDKSIEKINTTSTRTKSKKSMKKSSSAIEEYFNEKENEAMNKITDIKIVNSQHHHHKHKHSHHTNPEQDKVENDHYIDDVLDVEDPFSIFLKKEITLKNDSSTAFTINDKINNVLEEIDENILDNEITESEEEENSNINFENNVHSHRHNNHKHKHRKHESDVAQDYINEVLDDDEDQFNSFLKKEMMEY